MMTIVPKKNFPRCYREDGDNLILCDSVSNQISDFYNINKFHLSILGIKESDVSRLANKIELPASILVEAINQNLNNNKKGDTNV